MQTTTLTLDRFYVRQVVNGWVLEANCHMNSGSACDQYVFRTIPELADWLKLQVVRETSAQG